MKEIQLTGTWQDQATDLNENFGEISTTLDRIYTELSGGEGSGTSLQAEELKKLIRGTSGESSAFTDPQINLGSFSSVDSLNTRLNSESLFSAKYCGRLRANLNGQNLDIFQFAVSHSEKKYAQVAVGNIVTANIEGTSSRIALSNVPTARILRRVCENGVWGEWSEYGGGSSTGGSGGTEIYSLAASRSSDDVTIYMAGEGGAVLTGPTGAPLVVSIPSADGNAAGFMSKADKAKLNSLTSGGSGGTTEVFGVSKNGLVPGPAAASTNYFLAADGTWKVPAGGSTAVVTENANGLCPKLPEQSLLTTRYSVLNGYGKWINRPWILPFACYRGVSATLKAPDETKTTYKIVYDTTHKIFVKAVDTGTTNFSFYRFSKNEMDAMPYQIVVSSDGTAVLPEAQLYVATGATAPLVTSEFSPGLYAAIGGEFYLISAGIKI